MSSLQQDRVWVGMFVSAFLTVTMYYLLYTINQSLVGMEIGGKQFAGVRERFVATLAVFFNIIPFVLYIRVKKDNCMKGVGTVTVLLAIFMLIYYYILGHPTLFS